VLGCGSCDHGDEKRETKKRKNDKKNTTIKVMALTLTAAPDVNHARLYMYKEDKEY
jgi:hypothetical protein